MTGGDSGRSVLALTFSFVDVACSHREVAAAMRDGGSQSVQEEVQTAVEFGGAVVGTDHGRQLA